MKVSVYWGGSEPGYCWAHKRHRIEDPLDWHHVHPLGEGGPDVSINLVRLCPNAHRRVHAYIRLLDKTGGNAPWLRRKFYGHKIRRIGAAGYGAILIERRVQQDRNHGSDCDGSTCNYQEPHRHGFACDKTCEVCGGK